MRLEPPPHTPSTDGMFTNESDIAEFVQLYTEIQQTPPTVPFHWRVWEVKG